MSYSNHDNHLVMTTVGLPWTASSTRHWSPKLVACCSSHRVDPCKVFSFSAISRQDDYKERNQLDNQGRGGPCWSQGTAAEGRLQFLTALQMKPFSHKQSGNRISLAIFGIVWVCWPVLIDRALVYFVSICSNNVQLITHPSCPQTTTTTTTTSASLDTHPYKNCLISIFDLDLSTNSDYKQNRVNFTSVCDQKQENNTETW